MPVQGESEVPLCFAPRILHWLLDCFTAVDLGALAALHYVTLSRNLTELPVLVLHPLMF